MLDQPPQQPVDRKRLPSETLRYLTKPCPLGLLLLAASPKGVCALLFGDSEAQLLEELQARFRTAELTPDPLGLTDWTEAVLLQLDEPSKVAQVPLDLRGSAFEQRVWQALQQIPAGQTRRYGELATSLDSHARAVAGACARNPLGLLVPCHRVVGANQALTGYRWGIERKAALLQAESASHTRGA